MFGIEVIERIQLSAPFVHDYGMVRQGLAQFRAGQAGLFDGHMASRLSHFVECVLASAPGWDSSPKGIDVCRTAGEISELLSLLPWNEGDGSRRFRLRSALLYELADCPAISAAVLASSDVHGSMADFFFRRGPFRQLVAKEIDTSFSKRRDRALRNDSDDATRGAFVDATLFSDIYSLAEYEQGYAEEAQTLASDLLFSLGKDFSLEFTVTEINAWRHVLKKRASVAVRRFVTEDLGEQLRAIHFPPELWASQVAAINAGLLDRNYDSWGLAAPTGTGKTFITRLLIAQTLSILPRSVVVYLVPSRALVHEVSTALAEALQSLGYAVTAVTPQIVELEDEESDRIAGSSVLVLTPEKADLLLRLGADVFSRVSLVIIDEAHHLESGSRGVLLEMYLWRIRRILGTQARFVFLSAVAPNIESVVGWIGNRPHSLLLEQRATRMRVGVYRIHGKGKKSRGEIEYSDGTSVVVVPASAETASAAKALVQLAASVVNAGPVLIVAKGKKECEKLARLLLEWLLPHGLAKELPEDVLQGEVVQRLDSRLEREMYPEVELREFISNRIAYHHAGLPPSVRVGVEDAIRKNMVDYVFATTTLAEGVNFPFSTVIVESLALREPPEKGRPVRYHPVTPRVFWNIAGRAGRPGNDREGQVILFEPSLGLDKITYVLTDYLNPRLSSISPVTSALGEIISEIDEAVELHQLSMEALESVKLPATASKRVQGAINLLRVSLLHARASNFQQSPEEIYDGTFAATCLPAAKNEFARRIFGMQDQVVLEFLTTPNSPPPELIAELGLSIETLTDLREWVQSLKDWQFRNFAQLFYGGQLNLEQAGYVVGPVAKRMSELEGPKLGGFLSEVILLWLSGVPFNNIWKSKQEYWRTTRIEDLISVIYSRVQYLLPWGLYAVDRLVEAESKIRNVAYDNQVRSLAYLADAGVPGFDARRLVSADIERVDATRLAARYQQAGGVNTGMDVIGWLASEPIPRIIGYVRGPDQRRVDYDLENRLKDLRSAV